MKKPTYVIKQGEGNATEIVWRNTSLDKPTLADLIKVAKEHFPDTPFEKLGVLAGIMKLILKQGHDI